VARPSCLYCGAALPFAPAAPLAPAGTPPAPPVDRTLLVLVLEGADEDALARALGQPAYAAGLLARRGGLHLHRILEPGAAEAEAARLRADGLGVVLVPEAEARVRPVRALGGERLGDTLALRTEEGPLTLSPGDVLLVVRGAITREYQARFERRRRAAGLEEGYRVHLHRRAAPRPVELDAYNVELGFAVTGSARLELDAWVEAAAAGAPRDDAFRRLPPVLGPAQEEARGPLAAAGALGRASRRGEAGRDAAPLVLDNVAQFRFYSGWRAAVERRR
jgi:hypothetical protein